VKSGEADAWRRGRRAVSPCIHTGSNDAAFRWLSQVGERVRGSFHETAPRNTAVNTVRFDGSQPPRWQWKYGGGNNTTIFDNIDIGDMPTPIRRCSSRLRCYQFLMSDVYIGRTLLFIHRRKQWQTHSETTGLGSATRPRCPVVCPVAF